MVERPAFEDDTPKSIAQVRTYIIMQLFSLLTSEQQMQDAAKLMPRRDGNVTRRFVIRKRSRPNVGLQALVVDQSKTKTDLALADETWQIGTDREKPDDADDR